MIDEFGLDVERCRVGLSALLTLIDGVLLFFEEGILEAELHRAVVVLDRGDLFEDLLETHSLRHVGATGLLGFGKARLPGVVTDEPIKALRLQCEQVGNLDGVCDFGERKTRCLATVLWGLVCVARSSQGNYLQMALTVSSCRVGGDCMKSESKNAKYPPECGNFVGSHAVRELARRPQYDDARIPRCANYNYRSPVCPVSSYNSTTIH
ncbi:unannotated protein [freshwater metagenome]|uniref:Unannotated protein n=1 Tax=freshwater metagenome TaxID=449393 RepID=A0A6J6DBU2_9ZZZZ